MNSEEMNNELNQLLLTIEKINIQLGDNNRLTNGGDRMSNEEYNSWRRRAKHSKLKIEEKRRELKTLIIERKNQGTLVEFNIISDNPNSLLTAIIRMLNAAYKENRISLQKEEWDLIDIVRNYLQKQHEMVCFERVNNE